MDSVANATSMRARLTIDGREILDDTQNTSSTGDQSIIGTIPYVDSQSYFLVETSIVLEAEQAGTVSATGVIHYWIIES